MGEQKSSVLHRFALWLFSESDEYVLDTHADKDPAALRLRVEEAKNDWQAACSYFNNLADPELIDYAIYYGSRRTEIHVSAEKIQKLVPELVQLLF